MRKIIHILSYHGDEKLPCYVAVCGEVCATGVFSSSVFLDNFGERLGDGTGEMFPLFSKILFSLVPFSDVFTALSSDERSWSTSVSAMLDTVSVTDSTHLLWTSKKTTTTEMLSLEPPLLALSTSSLATVDLSPPSARYGTTNSTASSGLTTSHKPSQANMRKSSSPIQEKINQHYKHCILILSSLFFSSLF